MTRVMALVCLVVCLHPHTAAAQLPPPPQYPQLGKSRSARRIAARWAFSKVASQTAQVAPQTFLGKATRRSAQIIPS